MQVKVSNWAIFALLVLIGLLIFALIKGCSNNKSIAAKDAFVDTLQFRLKYNDSIRLLNIREYEGALQYANGIIDLRNNRIEEVEHENDSLNKQITSLLKKHKQIQPSTDTSVTLVPNEYIADCTDCFTLLDHSQQGNLKLRAEKDNLVAGYKSKLNLQDNRIKELGLENNNLRTTLSSAITTAQSIQDKNKPRGRLFFTLAMIGQKETFLIGGGGGLVYMDKRSRLYGGNYYGTNLGPMWTAQMSFPLSLRKKK